MRSIAHKLAQQKRKCSPIQMINALEICILHVPLWLARLRNSYVTAFDCIHLQLLFSSDEDRTTGNFIIRQCNAMHTETRTTQNKYTKKKKKKETVDNRFSYGSATDA